VKEKSGQTSEVYSSILCSSFN